MFLLEKYYAFISDNSNIPHKSKFHSEEFVEHIADVLEYVVDTVNIANEDGLAVYSESDKRILMLAALLHDIGKPATVFVDRDGNARFYSHEVISGIMVDDFFVDDPDCEVVKNLVVCHMLPFQGTYKTSMRKVLLNKFGLKFINLLDILHEADSQKDLIKHGNILNIIDTNEYDIQDIA